MLGDPRGQVGGGEHEVLGTGGRAHLLPGHGRGHRGPGPSAQRVTRDRGLVRIVLAPVHEHPAAPAGLRHHGGDPPRCLAGQLLGERLRELRRLLGAGHRDRHVQLHPLAAAGARASSDEVVVGEAFGDPLGHPRAVDHGGALTGIEIEDHQVGVVVPAARAEPPLRDVQLERGEVGRPGQALDVVDQGEVGVLRAPARRADPCGPDPVAGACRETSFSKNDDFSTPSGQRTIVTARSRRCGSITSATAR